MFSDAPINVWTNAAGLPVISLDDTAPLAPAEALEVSERLRQIARVAAAWPVVLLDA
jgi:hypothetical protein